MDMPVEGIFHNCVIVSLDKRYPMQSRRLMSALWGLGQMSFVKTIVTVDSKVNVHDYEEVAKLLLNKVDFETDLFFSEGVLDVLNHGSDQMLHGSKLGIDLTSKIEGEPGYKKEASTSTDNSRCPSSEKIMTVFEEVQACKVLQLQARRSVLLVALNKTAPHQGKQFIQSFLDHSAFSAIEIVIALEGHVDIENISTVMWKFFNNLDPKRDFYFEAGRLGIDVTQKFPEEGYQQNWPDEIEMTSEIKTQVDKRWSDLFKE
jgi:4-hydroxy-3-polyprenylbenzoate decarboxylase